MRHVNALVPIESLLRALAQKRVYAAYAVAACALLGILAIGWPVLKNQGFPLDDSWIYQVLGRNAARSGVVGFVPGRATGGSSSSIWPWIIALDYRLLPFLSPMLYLLIVNSLCLLGVLAVLYWSAVKDGLQTAEVVAVAALPAITGNFDWLISSGMEHLLFIAATFLAARFWLAAGGARNGPHTMLAAALFGLSVAARPEAVAFLPLFAAAGWWLGKPRRDQALFLALCVLFIALIALNNLWAYHSLLPPTFSGRRWMFLAQAHASPALLAARLLSSWALQIVTFFIGVEHTAGSLGYKVAVLGVCLALLMGVVRLVRLKAIYTLFLICLAAINLAVYCVILPVPGHGMRYQAMSLIFVFPLIALGALECIARLRLPARTAAQLMQAALFTAVCALALSSLHSWSQITELGIKHINATQVQMGRWLAQHVPAGTPVASFDIGAIGYFGQVRVIDLGGLTDPTITPYLYAGTVAQLLRREQVKWLVMSASGAMRAAASRNPDNSADNGYCDGMTQRLNLCDSPELRKKYLVSFSTPGNLWDRGFRATLHADQSQILYRLRWNHGSSATAALPRSPIDLGRCQTYRTQLGNIPIAALVATVYGCGTSATDSCEAIL